MTKKGGKISQFWHVPIVAEESLSGVCMVAEIAQLLYPELPMAADRQAKLYLEGGKFIGRVAVAAKDRHIRAQKMLYEWYSAHGGVARSMELARGEVVSDGGGI